MILGEVDVNLPGHFDSDPPPDISLSGYEKNIKLNMKEKAHIS